MSASTSTCVTTSIAMSAYTCLQPKSISTPLIVHIIEVSQPPWTWQYTHRKPTPGTSLAEHSAKVNTYLNKCATPQPRVYLDCNSRSQPLDNRSCTHACQPSTTFTYVDIAYTYTCTCTFQTSMPLCRQYTHHVSQCLVSKTASTSATRIHDSLQPHQPLQCQPTYSRCSGRPLKSTPCIRNVSLRIHMSA